MFLLCLFCEESTKGNFVTELFNPWLDFLYFTKYSPQIVIINAVYLMVGCYSGSDMLYLCLN